MNIEINKLYTIETGSDERIGSYPYEVVTGYRKGTYNHEGNFVAYRRYQGGLNRLQDDQFINFDTELDAIAKVKSWIKNSSDTVFAVERGLKQSLSNQVTDITFL